MVSLVLPSAFKRIRIQFLRPSQNYELVRNHCILDPSGFIDLALGEDCSGALPRMGVSGGRVSWRTNAHDSWYSSPTWSVGSDFREIDRCPTVVTSSICPDTIPPGVFAKGNRRNGSDRVRFEATEIHTGRRRNSERIYRLSGAKILGRYRPHAKRERA